MEKNIAVIKGDGIGPEIVDEAIKIIKVIESKYNHKFNLQVVKAGGEAIDATGNCLPDESLQVCKDADAVLLGAVGGNKWDSVPLENRPERALLKLRKELQVFSNIRPGIIYKSLQDASPLKQAIIEKGIDVCIVRELTGGIYFGKKTESDDGTWASDEMKYSDYEIRRIAKIAFESAMTRNKKVTSVDKANVLSVSRLWRKIVEEVSTEYPEVELKHLYVDNAAMQLVVNPSQFDVILTSNMFGDILSDEMSVLTGTIGLLPSASIGEGGIGLYEPIHGSAPDIAGQGIANPIGTILSVAMMLKTSFGMIEEGNTIEKAVEKFIEEGYRSSDIFNSKIDDESMKLSTSQIGDKIAEFI